MFFFLSITAFNGVWEGTKCFKKLFGEAMRDFGIARSAIKVKGVVFGA